MTPISARSRKPAGSGLFSLRAVLLRRASNNLDAVEQFAGLAGGLYAIFNSFISPDAIYWTSSGDILIMTMLGGAGTLIGPAIGTGVFLLLKNVASSYSEHWLMIIGVIFIACVMFFPGGIWGTLRLLRARARA